MARRGVLVMLTVDMVGSEAEQIRSWTVFVVFALLSTREHISCS